jgi:hypothetical protein
MSETGQIVLGICVLIIVYTFTRQVHAWRIKRAYMTIIKDLKEKEAFDPSSAVSLPYAKVSLFRFGTRDYRPKALEHLTMSHIVGIAVNGKYYLKDRNAGLPAPE